MVKGDKKMTNDEIIELNKGINELIIWMKLIYGDQVGSRLDKILDTEEKRKVYEATDGEHTVREISKEVGVSIKTISNWWKEWKKLSIVEPGHVRSDRPKRIISLKDFGLL